MEPLQAHRRAGQPASPMSRRRFFGSFSRHRASSFRAFGGTLPRSGSLVSTCARIPATSSPLNKRSPVSNSYSTTPNDHMSARLSTVLPSGLLRRHVRRCTEDDAHLSRTDGQCRRVLRTIAGGSPRLPLIRERFRQTEIQQLDDTFRSDLHVGGLQVAMDDALVVRVFERGGDLGSDVPGLVERQGAASEGPLPFAPDRHGAQNRARQGRRRDLKAAAKTARKASSSWFRFVAFTGSARLRQRLVQMAGR